jgi:hypothetical protein
MLVPDPDRTWVTTSSLSTGYLSRYFPQGSFWKAENSPPSSAEVRMHETLLPRYPYALME